MSGADSLAVAPYQFNLANAAQAGDVNAVRILAEKAQQPLNGLNQNAVPLILATRNNRQEVIRYLLNRGASVHIQDEQGRNALYYALAFNSYELSNLLLQFQANPNLVTGTGGQAALPLIQAVEKRNQNLVRLLLNFNADPNKIVITTPLLKSIEVGDVNITQQLLQAGANANLLHQNQSPLQAAIAQNRLEIARLLVEQSSPASLNLAPANANTPPVLIYFLQNRDVNTVRTLIARGADPNVRYRNQAAIQYAAEAKDWEACQLLVDKGARDLNFQDKEGNTMLHLTDNDALLQALIYKKANLNLSNRQGQTALSLAIAQNQTAKTDRLLLAGADVNLGNPLRFLIERRDYDRAQKLLKAGADANREGYLQMAIESKDIKMTELLLRDGKADPNQGEFLVKAVKSGQADLVELLLLYKANPNLGKPLREAVFTGQTHMVALLLEAGANPEEDQLIARSLENGHLEVAKLLIPKVKDLNEGAPLMIAAGQNNREIAELLLNRGADINAGFPLAEACKSRQNEMVLWLISKGANVNAGNPLQYAVRNNDLPLVKTLAQKGANVNASDLLAEASALGNLEMTQYLIENGADVNRGIALLEAVQNENEALCRLLIEKGADVNAGNPLAQAVQKGNLAITQLLITNRANIRQDSYLRYAVMSQSLPLCRYLVSVGVDLNTENPLLLASEQGQFDMAAYLLEAGADVYRRSAKNETLLHWAAFHGNLSFCQKLVEKGLPLDIIDQEQASPLARAVAGGHTSVAEYLLRLGANPNGFFPGTTLLHIAVKNLDINTVRLLLSQSNLKTDEDSAEGSPLWLAVKGKNLEIVRLLLNQGANVNYQLSGQALVHAAYESQVPEILELCLQNGANINATDRQKNSLLHRAIQDRQDGWYDRFINYYHIDVSLRQANGNTALHQAVQQGDLRLAQLLVEAGASLSDRNNVGQTIWTAFKKGPGRSNKSLSKYLKSRKAHKIK
ncbi:MAG: ankyrin repeat domain-containing protein [Microscillaceae bacterium]